MRAQQDVGILFDEERVLHVARRMFGREVERRENVPVILDLGPVGDGVAQPREDLDDLVLDDRDRVARPQLLGRTGTGHVFGRSAVVGDRVLKLLAQGVYAVEGRDLEFVELLPHFALEFRGHRLELFHQGVQFALLAEHFDAELLDLGRCLRFELFDTSEKFIDFVGHILIVYAFSVFLPVLLR